jgi:hypothetical protein
MSLRDNLPPHLRELADGPIVDPPDVPSSEQRDTPAEPSQEQLFAVAVDPQSGATQLRELPTPDDARLGFFHAPESKAPETERKAAIAVYPRTGTARRRVLDHIAAAGEHGSTDEEASLALQMRLYTAAPRRKELVDDGWVEDSGKRRPTATGTDAAVWVLTEQGRREWHAE